MSALDTLQQNLTDQLKALVGRQPASDERHQALATIAHFERRMWHPGVMDKLVQGRWPGMFEIDGGGALTYQTATDSPVETCEAVGRLLVEYAIQVMPDEDVVSDRQVFTTAEAAEYLGISVRTIKKYVYETGELKGTVRGHTLLFGKADLDNFRQQGRRPAGRPAVKG